jgi:hypothetical protein
MDGIAAVGTSTNFSREDHRHPSDTSRVNKAGDTMTGALNLVGGGHWAFASPAGSGSYYDTPGGHADRFFVGSDGTLDMFRIYDAALGLNVFQIDALTGKATLSIDPTDALGIATKQYVDARASATPADAFAFNGIQFNGSMEVSQENGATAVAITNASKYIVDGFSASVVGSGTAQGNQSAIISLPGFTNCLTFTATVANPLGGAGDYQLLSHTIEGTRWSRLAFGSGSAQPVTIGFWVFPQSAGTMAVALRNGAGSVRSYVVDVPVLANQWQYKTVTIPGDVAGTWNTDNTSGAVVSFCFGAGSATKGTANAWIAGNILASAATTNFFATAGAASTVYLTGVVVLPGNTAPTAARASFVMRPYDYEILVAKRYFYQGVPPARGVIVAGSFARGGCPHPVRMRAVPTVTVTAPLPMFDGAATGTVGSASANESTIDALEFEGTITAGAFTIGRPAIYYQGGGGNLKVDARL